jgi:hypothetical protein
MRIHYFFHYKTERVHFCLILLASGLHNRDDTSPDDSGYYCTLTSIEMTIQHQDCCVLPEAPRGQATHWMNVRRNP